MDWYKEAGMGVGGGQVQILMAKHTSMCVFQSFTFSSSLQTFYADNDNVWEKF